MTPTPVENAPKAILVQYFSHLLNDEPKMKRSSVATYQARVKAFYRWLHEEKYIAENPMRGLNNIKTDKRFPIWATTDEMNKLLNAAAVKSKATGDLRYIYMIKMLYVTGVRVSELVGIRKQDIDFGRGVIKIFGKGSKERPVMIPPEFACEIQTYLEGKEYDEQMFPFTTRTAENNVRELKNLAGIKKPLTPHKIRHTFATHILQNGGSVVAIQELLGHASLTTTQMYTHYGPEELRREYMKHPMYDEKKEPEE